MEGMFKTASFNQNINDWDVSGVKSMCAMFMNNKKFNKPLNKWNPTSVVDMNLMFYNTKFNQDISNWDVSNALSDNMFGKSKILSNFKPKGV